MLETVLSLRAVLTFLNVGLAALVSALFLAFITNARAERSLGNIQRLPGRWQRGLALIFMGTLVEAPAMVPGFLPNPARDVVDAAAYLFYYAGLLLAASATWGVPWPPPTPAEAAAAEEGAP